MHFLAMGPFPGALVAVLSKVDAYFTAFVVAFGNAWLKHTTLLLPLLQLTSKMLDEHFRHIVRFDVDVLVLTIHAL